MRRRVLLAVLSIGAMTFVGHPAGVLADADPPVPLLPRYVPDVEAQFAALSLRPDGLAFDIGDSPDPLLCKHYQGLARVDGPDGTPYLFVSRSGNQPGGFGQVSCPLEDDDPGNLLVVELGSRDRTGERLRSNRFVRGWPINGDISVPIGPTPPDPADRVVRTISYEDGSEWGFYAHPGGMQAIGDVLVVAVEAPYELVLGRDPIFIDLPDNLFQFIDVADPANPSLISQWEPPDPGDDFSAGLVGITAVRAPDGACCRYVMVAAGKANTDVRFYRSLPAGDGATTSDLRSSSLEWEETARFSELEIEECLNADILAQVPDLPRQFWPIDWHTGGGDAHQSLNLVREGGLDGPLYMLGARNDTPLPSGDDRLDLYRLHLDDEGVPEDCFLDLVDTTHVHSDPYMGGGDSLNFAAASGTHVTPSGELIVYGAEYENDGPVGLVSGRRTVRFGEFRHRDVVRSGSPTLRPSLDVAPTWEVDEGATVTLSATGRQAETKAWIQTYEDDGAGGSLPADLVDSDEWLLVEYVDRDADDFDDFGALRANGVLDENAGSWRWFAPVGCTIRANDFQVATDDDPGPDTVLLTGTGAVEVETDLDDIGFDDDLGSVSFLADCDTYYAAPIGAGWDLDDDGSYEDTGASATFDAATLDGPTTVPVAARAQHPSDLTVLGTGPRTSLTVRVRNVAPTIVTTSVTDAAGNTLGTDVPVVLQGLPVELSVTFTDPGVADTQTAAVDWDDGTVDTAFDTFTDASGGATGVLRQGHTFAVPGTYEVAVTVTDDDGGASTATTSVEVVSPADAIGAAADLLEDAVAAATDPDVADLLQRAIDWLLGNVGGQAGNGAVPALEDDDPESAISHLIAANAAIEEAEAAGGPDLSPIQDLLGLVAESLAVGALADATAAVDPPSRGEARQLDTIAALIDEGHAALLAGEHADAFDAFRQAVTRAVRLLA